MTLDDLKRPRPETFIGTVTPSLASQILNERNPVNRPLRDGVAEAYGRDMKADQWRLTNQGLGFDKSGNLLDGQHRLWGCVDAKTPFKTLIFVGLDENAREVIDIGLKRTDADVFGMRVGHRVKNNLIGAARMMVSVRDPRALARQQFLDFVERHYDALEFAEHACQAARGITTAPFYAAIARAWYTQDRDELTRFARIVASGMPEGQNWQPALLLRNWLVESKAAARGASARAEAYFKIETALRAFLQHTDLPKLYAAKGELFLVPDEQAPARAPRHTRKRAS